MTEKLAAVEKCEELAAKVELKALLKFSLQLAVKLETKKQFNLLKSSYSWTSHRWLPFNCLQTK